MTGDAMALALRAVHERRGGDVFVVSVGVQDAEAGGVAPYVCECGWGALFVEPSAALVRRVLGAPRITGAVSLDHASNNWRRAKRRDVRRVDLASALARHGVTRIDVLQVDADGREWPLLRQADVARHRPAIVWLRASSMKRADRSAAEAHLRDAGYEIRGERGVLVAVDARPRPHRTPVSFVSAVYDDPHAPAGTRTSGIGPMLLSLCSMAKMGAPFIVYTRPEHAEVLRRFAEDERLTWDVVGVELGATRTNAVELAKGAWLAAEARRNPFDSERIFWIDAALSTRDLFPERFVGLDGFDCSLFTRGVVRTLARQERLFAFGTSTQVSDVMFGGRCEEVDELGREYEEAVATLLAHEQVASAEQVLTALQTRRPERFTVERFTTWHHIDSGAYRPADDREAFYRFFERASAPAGAPAFVQGRPADVTVVLNTYKRPHALGMQHAAVTGQSAPPAEVFVWQNYPDQAHAVDVDPSAFDRRVLERCITVTSRNTNFGVWGRFAFALNARTKYVCVLDDDTIPGARWIENCLATMSTHRGLLGTVGVVQVGDTYGAHRRVGWCEPNACVEPVDYVGHAWFFEREWLTAFWRELPDVDLFAFPEEPHALCAGEDMHFSYTIQKYLGLRTFVPPHPAGDRSLWGSDPDLAMELGTDDAALSNLRQPNWKFDRAWASYRRRGFRLLRDG